MTFGSVKAHAPDLGPVTDAVEIILKIIMARFSMYWVIQEAVICEEAYMRVKDPGQVIDIKQKEEQS